MSANPTGPITVASGRNAILGDAVARLLEAHRAPRHARVLHQRLRQPGAHVRRERARCRRGARAAARSGYKGAYVDELATLARRRARPDASRRRRRRGLGAHVRHRGCSAASPARGRSRASARRSPDLGVHFDVWFSEESLHRWGAVDVVMRAARERRLPRARRTARSSSRRPRDGAGARATRTASSRRATATWTYFASRHRLLRRQDLARLRPPDRRARRRPPRLRRRACRTPSPRSGCPRERFEALLYQLVFIYQGRRGREDRASAPATSSRSTR